LRSGIAAFSTGTSCDSGPREITKPPGAETGVRGKAEQRRHQFEQMPHHGTGCVETGFDRRASSLAIVPPRHRLRQPVDLIQIEAERLADIAQRRAGR